MFGGEDDFSDLGLSGRIFFASTFVSGLSSGLVPRFGSSGRLVRRRMVSVLHPARTRYSRTRYQVMSVSVRLFSRKSRLNWVSTAGLQPAKAMSTRQASGWGISVDLLRARRSSETWS